MSTSNADDMNIRVASKRPAESPPPQSPPSGSSLSNKRMRAETDGQTSKKTEVDEWEQLASKLNDIFTGRADDNLDAWEAGWSAICDGMDESKKLRGEETALMKEIGTILKRCAVLERNVGMRG